MTSAASSHRPRRVLRRLLGAVLAVAAVVLLVPYLLVPLYRLVDPVSTLMVARWATGRPVVRSVVPLERIAPALTRAVIAAEDARFCTHRGIDWRELRTAFAEADELSEMRGGSTITQQVAKNLFLWPGRSVLRKALEAPLALWIDLVLPKRRILEIYLNVAEWGPNGVFGAEAASRAAFGKPAAALDAREAALLAVVLPNPRRRSARSPRPGLRRLAGAIQARAASAPGIAACVAARVPDR